MGLFQMGEQWLAKVAAKRVIYILAKGAAALLMYQQAQTIQQKFGITIDPKTFQEATAALMLGGLEALHDFLKVKFPALSKWI